MSKQTAVEWLMKQLSYDNGFGVRNPSHNELANLNHYFEQAIAMEKEQIKDAYIDGRVDYRDKIIKTSELFYNETYKGGGE